MNILGYPSYTMFAAKSFKMNWKENRVVPTQSLYLL